MDEFIMTTKQLDRLIASKVDEATRDLQERLAKTEKNRNSILREKRNLQRRMNGEEPEDDAPPEIVIPQDVSAPEFQRLKSEAEELGLPYRVDYTEPEKPAEPAKSKVKFVETDSSLFANSSLLEYLGIPGLERMAQERDKRLILFRSAEDLTEDARETHDQILKTNNPEALIEEGGGP